MYWVALLIGACIGVYVLTFVLRGVIGFSVGFTDGSMSKRKMTYVAIGVATIVAFVASGFGAADGGPPDFSESWIYAVAGLLVLMYERWRLTRREEESESVPVEPSP